MMIVTTPWHYFGHNYHYYFFIVWMSFWIAEEDDVPIEYYPVSRRLKHIGQQHVTPFTHLVYAFTW